MFSFNAKRVVILLFCILVCSPVFAETHHLKQIISGDVLVLDGGQTVRLIGIDTRDVKNKYKQLGPDKPWPEQKPYRSAEAFISDTVGEAPIEIETDDVNSGIGHKDVNGNLLAYVYIDVPKETWSAFDHTSVVPEIIKEYKHMDEQFIYDKKTHRIFLNASLIWSGNGAVSTERPFKHLQDFKKYETEAKQKGRGQWPT